MRRGALKLWVVALAVGCGEKSRSLDVRSATLPTAQARVQMLKDHLGSPGKVEDTAFHLVLHDNSGGCVPGPSDADFRVAVKVPRGDTELWTRGCTPGAIEIRPEWVDEVTRGAETWAVSSKPEAVRCGGEERLVHVKEGIVFRRVLRQ